MNSLQTMIAEQQQKYPLLSNYTVKESYINAYETLIGPLYQNKNYSACVLMRKHMNGWGSAHGGFLNSFAEFSMHCIAISHIINLNAIGQSYISLAINGKFLSSSKVGDLIVGNGVVIKEMDGTLFIKGQLTSNEKIIYDFNGILKTVSNPKISSPPDSILQSQKLVYPSDIEKYPLLKNYKIWEPSEPHENNVGPLYYHIQAPQCACLVRKKNMNDCNLASMGFLTTFADYSLFIIAFREVEEAGGFCVTLTLNSRFITSPKIGDLLQCTGVVVKNTRRLIFIHGKLISNGKLILDFDGILKKTTNTTINNLSNTNTVGKL